MQIWQAFEYFARLAIAILMWTSSKQTSTAMQRHNTENSKQKFPEKNFEALVPISTFMCLWAIYTVYSHDRSAYSAAGKYVDR